MQVAHRIFKNPIRIALLAIAAACSLPAPVFAKAGVSSTFAAPSTSPVTVDTCTWDHPGQNPFMGELVAAVDHYRDIAPEVRERLKARMASRDYDDVVSIRRDSITGRSTYASTISDMHFGTRQVCRSVTRAGWDAAMQERGLVYCDSGQCILVPTVCRNVSRISRAAPAPAGVAAAAAGPSFLAVEPSDQTPAFEAAAADMTVLALDAVTGFAGALAEPGASAESFAPAGGIGGTGSPAGATSFGGAGGAGGKTSSSLNALRTHPSGSVPQPEAALLASNALAPVPEPETWLLMLVGLGAVGAAARRGAAGSGVAT